MQAFRFLFWRYKRCYVCYSLNQNTVTTNRAYPFELVYTQMASSPGILPKKPGPQPLKATLPFTLTPTPDAHRQLSCPPNKIKTSWKAGPRKHSFGRISPPESSTRFQKKLGIHRTGSLGSLDPSLNYFASPRLFPPSPILTHSHLRNSPNVSSTDSEGSSVQLQSESVRKFKRIRPMRSASLDSAENIATAKVQHSYSLDSINPLPLPVDAPLHFFPIHNVSESRRVSLEGVDQEIALALNGLSINATQPEVCPDGHVAPAPFAIREVRSAGAINSPRSTQGVSPASAVSSRDSPGSACSSSPPDPRTQPVVKVHSVSPRCLFNREPPRGAVSVELRVASKSAGKVQGPDPRKVGIVLAGVGQAVSMSSCSAFRPIHQIAEATRPLFQFESPSSSPIELI